MFNFFNKKPKAEFIKNPTMQEKIDLQGDPLNDWHGDNPKGYENLELTDEEIDTFEMSSDFKTWKDIEEFSAEDSFENYYQDEKLKFPDMETLLELNTYHNLGYQIRAAKREKADQVSEHKERFDALPSHDPEKLDEYNLMNELAQKKGAESPKAIKKEKVDLSKIPLYSPAEVDLMQKAYVYKVLFEKGTQLNLPQPVYADGVPLGDEYINDQVIAWEKCKKNNEYAQYKPHDIALMKTCTNWKKLQDYILRGTQYPKGMDGNPLKKEEIDELANEFTEYTQEHIEDFVKNQVESGNWNIDKLSFKEYNFKGKKQWTAYKKISKEMVKLISRDTPIPLNGKGEYVYTIQEGGFMAGATQIVFIKTINPKTLTQNLIPKKQKAV